MPKDYDLLPEESDEQNQAFLEEVRCACQADPQAARSFALVRERLLAADSVQAGANNILSVDIYQQKKASTSRLELRVSKVRQKRNWSRPASLLAAALLATLIVGLLLITLDMARKTRTTTVSPQTRHQTARLEDLHMVDNQTGWATGTDGTVLRTTDGGQNWQDVTPPAILASNINVMWQSGTYDAFYGPSTAWITMTPNRDNSWYFRPANVSFIFHTVNGGQTWQEATLQTDGNITKQLDFINAQDGWLLTSTETATHVVTGPEHTLPSDLYATHDGGKTWVKILDAHSAQSAIFQDIAINGMNFSPDGQNGIITGGATLTGKAMLYMTHDGGKTWQNLAVASPIQSTSINEILNPGFFTDEDVYFTANLANANNATIGLTIFKISNGGATWTASPILPATPFQPAPGVFVPGSAGGASFSDMKHGWIVIHSGKATNNLYATRDGGQTWENVRAWNSAGSTTNPAQATSFSPASAFDFVSATDGWVLSSMEVVKKTATGTNATTTMTLYRTTDGGHTWTLVSAHFPSFIG